MGLQRVAESQTYLKRLHMHAHKVCVFPRLIIYPLLCTLFSFGYHKFVFCVSGSVLYISFVSFFFFKDSAYK